MTSPIGYGVIRSAVSGIVLRFMGLLCLWVSAPPFLPVILAWMLLRDCDFGLVIAGILPGSHQKEKDYFRNKVCWITGASSGIGRALAVLLARRGAYVILSGRQEGELLDVAEECQRTYLVSQIRSCRRSESGIDAIVNESQQPRRARAMVLPYDMSCTSSNINALVRCAISWRGSVDILFNNAGTSECAFVDETSLDISTMFQLNCFPHLKLIKALLPCCIRNGSDTKGELMGLSSGVMDQLSSSSATDKKNDLASVNATASKLRFPEFQRLSTSEFHLLAPILRHWRRFVGSSASKRQEILSELLSIQTSSYFSFSKRLYQWILGPQPTYHSAFHIVNTLSTTTRLVCPGAAGYTAAKCALGTFSEALRLEVYAAGVAGLHSTEFNVTNCYPGHIPTQAAQRALLANGQPAGDNGDNMMEYSSKFTVADDISAERCAELMARATAYKLSECWITRQPEITYMYLQYYLPWVWRYVYGRCLAVSDFLRVKKRNENKRQIEARVASHAACSQGKLL